MSEADLADLRKAAEICAEHDKDALTVHGRTVLALFAERDELAERLRGWGDAKDQLAAADSGRVALVAGRAAILSALEAARDQAHADAEASSATGIDPSQWTRVEKACVSALSALEATTDAVSPAEAVREQVERLERWLLDRVAEGRRLVESASMRYVNGGREVDLEKLVQEGGKLRGYKEVADYIRRHVTVTVQTVAARHPPPHHLYLVWRKGREFTATPCYGMHAPRWVVRKSDGTEDPPIAMEDTDRWRPVT
jgi:hypothetical protein